MNKVFIDSNIIIRLIVKDSKEQLIKAQKIIQDIEDDNLQGILSILVVNEIIWILEHYYNLKREQFIPSLLKLLSIRKIKIFEVKKDTIINVLHEMKKKKIDFTDLYLLENANSHGIVSFDKDFEKAKN